MLGEYSAVQKSSTCTWEIPQRTAPAWNEGLNCHSLGIDQINRTPANCAIEHNHNGLPEMPCMTGS